MVELEKIEMNDLSKWSPWPQRLLGLVSWDTPTRTVERVAREYDQDEYAYALAYWREHPAVATPEDVHRFQSEKDPDTPVCISEGDELYKVTFAEMRARYEELLALTIGRELGDAKTIVELGAGYGINLWNLRKSFPEHTLVGADYSENAVELAAQLYATEPRLNFFRFNFYDAGTYGFLERCEPPLLVFTSHALEQLPSCEAVIDALFEHRRVIERVIHFEPLYGTEYKTLMAMMRRRYVEVNDYNRDLLDQLRARQEIELMRVEENRMGRNPLNPSSVVVWRFR